MKVQIEIKGIVEIEVSDHWRQSNLSPEDQADLLSECYQTFRHDGLDDIIDLIDIQNICDSSFHPMYDKIDSYDRW